MSRTTPLTVDGTSTTALSVSSSMTGWPSVTAAPGEIIRRTRSPESMFSPSSGILNSVGAVTVGFRLSTWGVVTDAGRTGAFETGGVVAGAAEVEVGASGGTGVFGLAAACADGFSFGVSFLVSSFETVVVAEPLPFSTVKITCPTRSLSPSFTRISPTVPVTDDGTSTTALSVSSSITGSPSAMLPPGLIIKRTRSPLSIFSPSSGSLNSVAILSLSSILRLRGHGRARTPVSPLTDCRVAFFRIDAEIADCFFQKFRADGFARILFRILLIVIVPLVGFFVCQCMQRSQHDVLRIHFEEVSQRSAILAAPETICAERHQLARNPLRDTFRQYLHVIRRGDERASCAFQRLGNVGYFCFLRGMQHVPARA